MAEIQIVFREGYCDSWERQQYRWYGGQCHTCAADYVCNRPLNEYGCVLAKWRLCYKGMTTKKYEMRPSEDDGYNPHLACMEVTVGGRQYECVKVSIDGECVYNVLDKYGEMYGQEKAEESVCDRKPGTAGAD